MQKTLKRYFPIIVQPTLIAFSFAFIIPFVMGVYLSFCKFKSITNAQFVGLENYIKFFADLFIFSAQIFVSAGKPPVCGGTNFCPPRAGKTAGARRLNPTPGKNCALAA